MIETKNFYKNGREVKVTQYDIIDRNFFSPFE